MNLSYEFKPMKINERYKRDNVLCGKKENRICMKS